jgi:hypothetical protein
MVFTKRECDILRVSPEGYKPIHDTENNITVAAQNLPQTVCTHSYNPCRQGL